ncbi:BTB/POZ domain-containing protein, partial [Aphelenchoides avenae]
MSSISPVFERLFQTPCIEKGKRHIVLEKVDPRDFHEFLLAIHPTERSVKTNNVLALSLLSDRFEVLTLRNKCELFLAEDKELPLFNKLCIASALTTTSLRNLLISRMSAPELAQVQCNPRLSALGAECLAALLRKLQSMGSLAAGSSP